LVADPETNELLHYTEKPETFVSAVLLLLLYLLVYIFSVELCMPHLALKSLQSSEVMALNE